MNTARASVLKEFTADLEKWSDGAKVNTVSAIIDSGILHEG